MKMFLFFFIICLVYFFNRLVYRQLTHLAPKSSLFIRITVGSGIVSLILFSVHFFISKLTESTFVFLQNVGLEDVRTAWLGATVLVLFVDLAFYNDPNKNHKSWLQAQGEKSFDHLFFKMTRRAAIVLYGFFLIFFLLIFLSDFFHSTPSNFTDRELQTMETDICTKSEVLGALYSVKKICSNNELKLKVDQIYMFLKNEETKLGIKSENPRIKLNRRSLRIKKKNFGEALLNCASDECIASTLSGFDCEMRLIDESPSSDLFSAEKLCRANIR
jgi:hypothetical protein